MRVRTLIQAGLCLVLVAAGAAAKNSKTVQVDCDKGDSINAALETKADELVIEIRGICHENVVVERDFVTLIGIDPELDGVHQASSETTRDAAVFIRDARWVQLQGLSLVGSDECCDSGIRVHSTDTSVDIVNCRLAGFRGVVSSHVGGVTIHDSVFDVINYAVGSAGGSVVICNGCEIQSDLIGVLAVYGGILALDQGTIEAPVALYSGWGSHMGASQTELSGSIWTDNAGRVRLEGVAQTSNPWGNEIADGSSLWVSGGSLSGPTLLTGFSDGKVTAGATVGTLECLIGSDLYCDGTEAKIGSSCALCPESAP